MISRTMRGAMYAGGFLGNSTVWRYAKKRGLWYYRLLLSNRFADVMSDIFEMTELEKKLNKDNWNSPVRKRYLWLMKMVTSLTTLLVKYSVM